MKKQYLVAIIVIALIGTIAFATPAIIKKFLQSNPSTQLLYALSETSKAEKMHTNTSTKMEVDLIRAEHHEVFEMFQDPSSMVHYLNSILSGMEIGSIATYSSEDMSYVAHSYITYKNKPLLQIGGYLNDKLLAFAVPQLSDRLFSLEADTQEAFDLKKYRDILMETADKEYKDLQANKETYLEPVMGFLDVHVKRLEDDRIEFTHNAVEKTYKTDVIELTFTENELNEFAKELIKILQKDDQARALIKKRGEMLLDAFIESKDYQYFDMTEEDAAQLRASFQNEFDTDYTTFLNDLYDSLLSVSTPGTPMTENSFQVIFSIDPDGKIRRIRNTALSDFIKTTTVYDFLAYDNEVVLESLSLENKTDLSKLLNNDQEIAAVTSEVINNLYANILSGEAFTTLVEDLKTNSDILPEDERTQILAGIDEMMKAIQMLPFLFMGF